MSKPVTICAACKRLVYRQNCITYIDDGTNSKGVGSVLLALCFACAASYRDQLAMLDDAA